MPYLTPNSPVLLLPGLILVRFARCAPSAYLPNRFRSCINQGIGMRICLGMTSFKASPRGTDMSGIRQTNLFGLPAILIGEQSNCYIATWVQNGRAIQVLLFYFTILLNPGFLFVKAYLLFVCSSNPSQFHFHPIVKPPLCSLKHINALVMIWMEFRISLT